VTPTTDEDGSTNKERRRAAPARRRGNPKQQPEEICGRLKGPLGVSGSSLERKTYPKGGRSHSTH